MKKVIFYTLNLVLVSLLFMGCGTKNFTISGMNIQFTNIEITDGMTGITKTLDAEQSQELYNKIKSIELVNSSSGDRTGWSYSIKFINQDSETSNITILDASTLDYGGKLYKTKDGSIDIEYMKSLFYYSFQAEVIEAGKSLLVAPDPDSMEYRSSDKIAVNLYEATIYDVNQQTISADQLKAGDIVKITYNGVVAESYPAQISCYTIELINNDLLLDGYMAILEDIYNEDPGLNGDISLIAIDTSTLTNLSDQEISLLLSKMKETFGMEIIKGTFDELAEQGLIDKEKLLFESGILIEIKNPIFDNKTSTLKGAVSKWRSGLGAIGYDATARFNGTEWKLTKASMWIS
jgi:hypothetical protein